MENRFDLSGKSAIVTGGTGVLGGAISDGLACAGARVGVLGRNEQAADLRVQEITEEGGEAIPLIADVLERDQLIAARDKVLDAWGQIDIIVNCAGGNMEGATINPDQSFLNVDDEAISKVVDLNFMGTYYPSKIFGASIIENKKGVIVNISSMAAQSAITRVMGYSAAKSAVDNFTRSLAVEMALKYGDGIRVNAIAPGFFIGEQNKDLLLNEDGSLTNRGQTIVDNTPMKRFGEPDELVGTAIWLCSDASKFVTGTVIPVDGGFSAFSGV